MRDLGGGVSSVYALVLATPVPATPCQGALMSVLGNTVTRGRSLDGDSGGRAFGFWRGSVPAAVDERLNGLSAVLLDPRVRSGDEGLHADHRAAQ